MKLTILIFLTTLCLNIKAQSIYSKIIINDTVNNRVSEPVELYRKWVTDMIKCDSLRKIDADQLNQKDSINVSNKKEIKELNDIIAIKDTTIKKKDITIKEKDDIAKQYKDIAEKAIKENKGAGIFKQPLLYIIILGVIVYEQLSLK